MSIIKETQIAKIEVVGKFKAVQVAIDTVFKENNIEIDRKRTNRYVLHSDMDISNEPQEVKDICNTAWTQEVKDAWNTFKQEQENEE